LKTLQYGSWAAMQVFSPPPCEIYLQSLDLLFQRALDS
jgi:hypothetical protein